MRVMTFEEVKSVELEVLQYVSDYCDKNNLQYYLAYGTLIGAVRHKGFIPWDDDIDIWMPREDYNRIINEFNNNPSHYRLISPTDKISRHSFVKIIDVRTVKIEPNVSYTNGHLGIDIDIFPLDGQPDDDTTYSLWYENLQKKYRLYPFTIAQKMSNYVKTFIVKLVNLGDILKKFILNSTRKLHLKYPYNTSNYVGTIESCYNSKNNRFKKEWFSEHVLLDFEGRKFKVPVGYHEVLTKMYGDYMKLPPKEQQITHHSNNNYWKEESDE